MFELHTKPVVQRALYCPRSGMRVPPTEGLEPTVGSPVAVAVLAHGLSIPILGDTLFGRDPKIDHRVAGGECKPVVIEDNGNWISRSHVLLRVFGWQVAAIDLGSANGTQAQVGAGTWKSLVPGLPFWLNGKQQLRLGVHKFTVHPVGG